MILFSIVVREGNEKMFGHPYERHSVTTNIFEGRISSHRRKESLKKAFIEETTRQDNRDRYVDMRILAMAGTYGDPDF